MLVNEYVPVLRGYKATIMQAVALLVLLGNIGNSLQYASFIETSTIFNHMVVHPKTEMVYIGAVNYLFQLTADLNLLSKAETGPVSDNPQCLPPIIPKECPHAQSTNNTNKVLALAESLNELITCGSVLQGICEKRSLESVEKILFQTKNPLDSQYVAANDPKVTTVALVEIAGGKAVLFVGRGHTNRLFGGVPPITIRHLEGSSNIFSSEDMGKLVVQSFSEYNNHFIKVFTYGKHIFFLFFRRDLKSKMEYKTYVSRLCINDLHFFSYVEVPLSCTSEEGVNFNLAQSAHLSLDGIEDLLFITMTVGQASSPVPTQESALCVYSLKMINEKIEWARSLCYIKEGKNGNELAYVEYEVKSSCLTLPESSTVDYPCGDEHTPSPIATKEAVPASAALFMATQLSAVITTTEGNCTVAFLGDIAGFLYKVYLKSWTEGEVYSKILVEEASVVNADIYLNAGKDYLYVMTYSQVKKIPVSECFQYIDCASCLQNRDPYCGWCVLEGRCSRKVECNGSENEFHWLWSYSEGIQCLTVETIFPANQSRTVVKEVMLTLNHLPSLSEDDHFNCLFGQLKTSATVMGIATVICDPPSINELPSNELDKDYVRSNVSVQFGRVTIATINYIFYDCSAVTMLSVTAPCRGCVCSPWGCNWCPVEHRCTEEEVCQEQRIIYNQNRNGEEHVGPDACPCVTDIDGPTLMPVGLQKELRLVGQNLHLLEYLVNQEYTCVLEVEEACFELPATVIKQEATSNIFNITCQPKEYHYLQLTKEYFVPLYLKWSSSFRIDSKKDVQIILYKCSVENTDCSQCKAADSKYHCVWCKQEVPGCVYSEICITEIVEECPGPFISEVEPLSGPVEGGISITIFGSNLGQSFDDIESVTVAGIPCNPRLQEYDISIRIVCDLSKSEHDLSGPVRVKIRNHDVGISEQNFTYQNPELQAISPDRGPLVGGTSVTVSGTKLLTGNVKDIRVFIGELSCSVIKTVQEDNLVCCTSASKSVGFFDVKVVYGKAERLLKHTSYEYTHNPSIADARPVKGFYGGGRIITIKGDNLDVVQKPLVRAVLNIEEASMKRKKRQDSEALHQPTVPPVSKTEEACVSISTRMMKCGTPAVPPQSSVLDLVFILDNLHASFYNIVGQSFQYMPNPQLFKLHQDNFNPYRLKSGALVVVEGKNLTEGIGVTEVVVEIGTEICVVKTLTSTSLYCNAPQQQPQPLPGAGALPDFVVRMGKLEFNLGKVEFVSDSQSMFPVEAQIGLGAGAAVVVCIVLIIILMYRRKSKKAMQDYQKVLVQLENLEVSVGDQCRKEFTDLMTEMMDVNSDLGGTGIPFLDYRTFTERIFFPGHKHSPLRSGLDTTEHRKSTVEQGLTHLSSLLNNKIFLTKFIHTLEEQQTFSQRDRGYVASLLSIALHDRLEYYTDIMKTLLGDLVEQYVIKNPKLMLRRTETVVEKLLTNWMSICLYSFIRNIAGEPLYMLYRAIKYQVDKGPVDAVTGKAKRTLNDSRLLREDIEYQPLTLNVLMKNGGEVQWTPVRVLDTDTITQVKEKILDQIYKGAPFSQRTSVDALNLEWRSGIAGHLTLSDEDVTSVVQGEWKQLNTLQHYKVPDGANVALIPTVNSNFSQGMNQALFSEEKIPMLEDLEEEGIKLWHLVKLTEDPELPKYRKSSLRERAKVIPEIYLTRLLSMKGTLQKFVDDVFHAILNTHQPVPVGIRYFFDFLDEMAEKHDIKDQETVHVWKTNSLLLRFWVNILKNPQFIFDVNVSDNVDAILSVIAQTFIDSCTTSEHKVGRDSPVNKLLYAREIPRYKQLVEKYYHDIQSASAASYQEMNSTLTELSGNCVEVAGLNALCELYKYINKYYDQIISALEDDAAGQKMQLSCRLQQIAALVENKVTDL